MQSPMASLVLAIFFSASAIAGPSAVQPDDVPDVLIREKRTVLPRVAGAAEDYSRNCQGCHGHLGVSVAEVPALRSRVGYFTHTLACRAYLVQVPNVLQSPLSDARLAGLLNWLLDEYSREQLPPDFQPYTADEIAALRSTRIESVIERRREVVDALVRAGVVPDASALSFSFAPGHY